MGRHGADLLESLSIGTGILTHCNAGGLAGNGDGTRAGRHIQRPRRRQAPAGLRRRNPAAVARGTADRPGSCMQRGIDVTLICDAAWPPR